MTMLPRDEASATITNRPVASASIANRVIAGAQMLFHASVASIVRHFRYNQPTQPYQSPISYNYSTTNGDMAGREVASATMKGK